MKKRLLLIFVSCCYLFSFTNCSKDETYSFSRPTPGQKPKDNSLPRKKTNRTVLAYFVADMNLWFKLEESINLMEKGWDDSIDGTLLLYLDKSSHLTQFDSPVLLKIKHDETRMIVSEIVKTYPEQDAGDPNKMQSVLNDAITLYPAESHGLIIAAHGNGFVPEITLENDTKSLSGSERYGSTLEIDVLAKILPLKYDFIMFHACNMINVETVYQLRNKCEYVMGSVFSLPGEGYPYDKIIPFLYTKPKADLYKSSLLSLEEYENRPSTMFQNFSVEVVKTSELENLAAETSKFLDNLNMSYDDIGYQLYRTRGELAEAPIPDEDKNFVIDYYGGILLDLKGIAFLAEDEMSDSFVRALDKAVVNSYSVGFTPNSWKRMMTNLGSGLSFYLPFKDIDPAFEQFNKKYKERYDWAKDSGFAKDR